MSVAADAAAAAHHSPPPFIEPVSRRLQLQVIYLQRGERYADSYGADGRSGFLRATPTFTRPPQCAICHWRPVSRRARANNAELSAVTSFLRRRLRRDERCAMMTVSASAIMSLLMLRMALVMLAQERLRYFRPLQAAMMMVILRLSFDFDGFVFLLWSVFGCFFFMLAAVMDIAVAMARR